MKMPNADLATITDEKLLRYVLNPAHAVGGPHAKLFDRLLGINLACADVLREALLRAASDEEASLGKPSPFGQKFEIRFSLTGPNGSYNILSVWMIKTGTASPQLITAYVTK
jgi:hypothetical protein